MVRAGNELLAGCAEERGVAASGLTVVVGWSAGLAGSSLRIATRAIAATTAAARSPASMARFGPLRCTSGVWLGASRSIMVASSSVNWTGLWLITAGWSLRRARVIDDPTPRFDARWMTSSAVITCWCWSARRAMSRNWSSIVTPSPPSPPATSPSHAPHVSAPCSSTRPTTRRPRPATIRNRSPAPPQSALDPRALPTGPTRPARTRARLGQAPHRTPSSRSDAERSPMPVTAHDEQIASGIRHPRNPVPMFPRVRKRIRCSLATTVDAEGRRQRLTQPTLMDRHERLETIARRHQPSLV